MAIHVCCHHSCLSLEQSNQHQHSSKASTASTDNSEKDRDTKIPRIIEPPKQMLRVTNFTETSSDSENEYTDSYETLKQKYHNKESASNPEDLSLSLPIQQSILLKEISNVNKEPITDMIIRFKTDIQNSLKQVKILSARKVSQSKPGKYKNHWNVLDDQRYTKVIEFENDVEKWEEFKSDHDDETTQLPNPSINHLSKTLSDLQIIEKECDANSTDKILVNQPYVTQVNHKLLNNKQKDFQS